jgi:hypothetical protein
MATAIKLGDKVKDTISGFEGIVTGRFEYLNGCVRLGVDPDHLDKDGKRIEGITIDEPQVRLITASVIPQTAAPVGGPRPHPAPRSAPSR